MNNLERIYYFSYKSKKIERNNMSRVKIFKVRMCNLHSLQKIFRNKLYAI